MEIDKTDLGSYSLTNKTFDTYASVSIVHRNPRKGKLIKYDISDILNTNSSDKEIFTGKVDNSAHAEQRVKGGLWGKNKFKETGNLNDMQGDPLLVAGNNFDLTGFGLASGKYHIVTSTHTISGGSVYTTSLEIRKTGTIPKPKRVQRVAKPKPTQQEEVQEATGEDGETEENN